MRDALHTVVSHQRHVDPNSHRAHQWCATAPRSFCHWPIQMRKPPRGQPASNLQRATVKLCLFASHTPLPRLVRYISNFLNALLSGWYLHSSAGSTDLKTPRNGAASRPQTHLRLPSTRLWKAVVQTQHPACRAVTGPSARRCAEKPLPVVQHIIPYIEQTGRIRIQSPPPAQRGSDTGHSVAAPSVNCENGPKKMGPR